MKKLLVIVFCISFLTVFAAEDRKKPEFTSKGGKAAQASYKEDLWKAEEAYFKKVLEAKEKYEKSLSTVLVQAYKDKNKDEAQRILDARKSLQDEIEKVKEEIKMLKCVNPDESVRTECLAEAKKEDQRKKKEKATKAIVGAWWWNKSKKTVVFCSNGTVKTPWGDHKWEYIKERQYKYTKVEYDKYYVKHKRDTDHYLLIMTEDGKELRSIYHHNDKIVLRKTGS